MVIKDYIGKKIIETGKDWIKLDDGTKIFLGDGELDYEEEV